MKSKAPHAGSIHRAKPLDSPSLASKLTAEDFRYMEGDEGKQNKALATPAHGLRAASRDATTLRMQARKNAHPQDPLSTSFPPVPEAVQQHALCRQPVPARAPRLLEEALDALGQVVVKHQANVTCAQGPRLQGEGVQG